jgi:aminoglycoside phosphotransferase (APT) family kinase protein
VTGVLAADAEMADAIGTFLAEKLEAAGLRVVSFTRHVEGFSWETYAIAVAWHTDEREVERRFIVHRVPASGLLAPYRPRTVFELRKALEDIVGVPGPRALWLDEEGAATGRPLYVVEMLSGEVPSTWTSHSFFTREDARRSAARELMEIAAALHAAPLSIAPKDLRGSATRNPVSEIDHWQAIYRDECLEPVPVLDWGFAWVYANTDKISERISVVHGDFRTGNYMLRDGRIIALLDWEEAHIGDPVQDLAHCALRLFRGRTRQASGLVQLADLLAFYEDAAGWDVPREAFHFWCVYEAVYTAVTMHRANSIFASGATHDVRYAAFGCQTHHTHRDVIDYIEAAERGDEPM